MNRNNPATILVLAGGCLLFQGCGRSCRETVRMGDFEFSQGNYARAEKLFAQARAEDPAACPDARDKLENARRFLKP